MEDKMPICLEYKEINLGNHIRCHDYAALGPADPREPSALFWGDKMQKWLVPEGVARTRLCMNCAHYDNSQEVMDAFSQMPPGAQLTEADLPFQPQWATIAGQPSAVCTRWAITCSALRTCDDWEAPWLDPDNANVYFETPEDDTEDETKAAAISLKPTSGMASEAARGLKWKEEGKAGGTRVGLARANQLVKRENLTESTVMRMYSFFKRHEVDQDAEGFSPGEDGYPSAGRVAWALWGGDAGYTWATKKRNQILNNRGK